MRIRSHPAEEVLAGWLESGQPEAIGRPVADCEQCLLALEDLSAIDDRLVADLTDALAAPAGLEARTASAVERRLRDDAALSAFADLFAVAGDLARIVLDPDGSS